MGISDTVQLCERLRRRGPDQRNCMCRRFSVDTEADMACSLDMQWSISSMVNPKNLAIQSNDHWPMEKLLLMTDALQVSCCDSSVMVVALKAVATDGLNILNERNRICPREKPSIGFCDYLHQVRNTTAKILLDPLVRTSPDADNFRLSRRLFPDIDYHRHESVPVQLKWEEIPAHLDSCIIG